VQGDSALLGFTACPITVCIRAFCTAESAPGSASSSTTPPGKQFADWLAQNKPGHPLTYQEAVDLVKRAPLSAVNKDFLLANLRAVPAVGPGQLNCPVRLDTVFPRPDFVKVFETLRDKGVNVCVAQGLRRLGKSVSILEAVLTARAEVGEPLEICHS
jgi:hypothetical protein